MYCFLKNRQAEETVEVMPKYPIPNLGIDGSRDLELGEAWGKYGEVG